MSGMNISMRMCILPELIFGIDRMPDLWKIKVLHGRPVVPDEISGKCRLIVLEFAEEVSIKDILQNLYDEESAPVELPGCVICQSGPSWVAVIKTLLSRFASILTDDDNANKIIKGIQDDE